MAFTSLLSVSSTSGEESTPRTIAAGEFERIGLKQNGNDTAIQGDCEMRVLVADDAGRYRTALTLTNGNITEVIAGPTTYMLERVKGDVGAYAEHA